MKREKSESKKFGRLRVGLDTRNTSCYRECERYKVMNE